MIVVKTFDVYPAEILNRKAKSWIGETRRIRIKTNKTSSSNPTYRFGPGFFWQSGFGGLNWYLFVVSISFPLKYWIFPCLGLRRLIIKSNAAKVGQPVYNLTIFWYFFTYFHDKLGQEITWWKLLDVDVHWSWGSYLLLLLVYAVVLFILIMVPLLSYFLEFLIYQSPHFQFR